MGKIYKNFACWNEYVVLYKLAAKNGMSLRIITAYRFLFAVLLWFLLLFYAEGLGFLLPFNSVFRFLDACCYLDISFLLFKNEKKGSPGNLE